jgi:hypothetical protein
MLTSNFPGLALTVALIWHRYRARTFDIRRDRMGSMSGREPVVLIEARGSLLGSGPAGTVSLERRGRCRGRDGRGFAWIRVDGPKRRGEDERRDRFAHENDLLGLGSGISPSQRAAWPGWPLIGADSHRWSKTGRGRWLDALSVLSVFSVFTASADVTKWCTHGPQGRGVGK